LNSQDFFTNRKIVVSLAVLCCLLWGSAFPAIKNGYALFEIAAHDIPGKLVFAGVRFFISGLLLLLIAAAMNKPLGGLSVKNLGELGLLGLTQTALQYAFFYIGLAYTTGVKGSILNATSTFFSVLLAHVIYRNDRLSTGRTLGCLIGFAGVVIINFSKDLRDFDFTLLGDGSIVMTSFIFSAASIYGKRLSQKMDSIVMTGYQLSIGGLALTVAGYATGGELTNFTAASTSMLVYLILCSSAAFGLWSILLKYNRVSVVAVFNFLIPVFGSMLSAIFLNENILEWKNALALIFVCYGIWLVTQEKEKAGVPAASSKT
jgi:drug/metabolite transporter (DMT)-like permease